MKSETKRLKRIEHKLDILNKRDIAVHKKLNRKKK